MILGTKKVFDASIFFKPSNSFLKKSVFGFELYLIKKLPLFVFNLNVLLKKLSDKVSILIKLIFELKYFSN